jgi:hypothetical protein
MLDKISRCAERLAMVGSRRGFLKWLGREAFVVAGTLGAFLTFAGGRARAGGPPAYVNCARYQVEGQGDLYCLTGRGYINTGKKVALNPYSFARCTANNCTNGLRTQIPYPIPQGKGRTLDCYVLICAPQMQGSLQQLTCDYPNQTLQQCCASDCNIPVGTLGCC